MQYSSVKSILTGFIYEEQRPDRIDCWKPIGWLPLFNFVSKLTWAVIRHLVKSMKKLQHLIKLSYKPISQLFLLVLKVKKQKNHYLKNQLKKQLKKPEKSPKNHLENWLQFMRISIYLLERKQYWNNFQD